MGLLTAFMKPLFANATAFAENLLKKGLLDSLWSGVKVKNDFDLSAFNETDQL